VQSVSIGGSIAAAQGGMTMRKRFLASLMTGLATVSVLGLAAANAQPASKPAQECFYSNNWDGWKATPDGKSIFIRVGVSKIYRLDLSSACPALLSPNTHLITKMHGSSSICGALDFDLQVSDGSGFSTPCIVSEMTPLSKDEASALPKELRP
jgi:hypothetical protein